MSAKEVHTLTFIKKFFTLLDKSLPAEPEDKKLSVFRCYVDSFSLALEDKEKYEPSIFGRLAEAAAAIKSPSPSTIHIFELHQRIMKFQIQKVVKVIQALPEKYKDYTFVVRAGILHKVSLMQGLGQAFGPKAIKEVILLNQPLDKIPQIVKSVFGDQTGQKDGK
jgi:hypothetical protein